MLTHFSITQQGESHIKKDSPCQDYSGSHRFFSEKLDKELVVSAISDGVGSCGYSQYGSEIAVTKALHIIETALVSRELGEFDELNNATAKRLFEYAFDRVLECIEIDADERQLPFMEYDCTLTVALYDGDHVWYGHIGDDGIVVMYKDGLYEMLTTRHKGEEAHSVFPLRCSDKWQFGYAMKPVASYVMMTDGVLDYCVDNESMGNRVYFPFLSPALISPIQTDEQMEDLRNEWAKYLQGAPNSKNRFRDRVTDDISVVSVMNTEAVAELPPISFDMDAWNEATKRRRKEIEESLYENYRKFKENSAQKAATKKEDSNSSANESASNTAENSQATRVTEKPSSDVVVPQPNTASVSATPDPVDEQIPPRKATSTESASEKMAPKMPATDSIPPVSTASEDTIPSDASPTVMPPVDISPANTAPADVTPATSTPVDTVTADVPPATSAPVDTVTADVIPATSTPADTAPVDTASADEAPMKTAHVDNVDYFGKSKEQKNAAKEPKGFLGIFKKGFRGKQE